MHFTIISEKNKMPAAAAGILFFLFLFQGSKSFSQAPVVLNDYEHKALFTDINGKAFINPDVDVTGSPFFFVAWKYGTLKLNSKTISDKIPLRLDLKNHEIHFLQSGELEMTAPAGSIKEIVLYDSSAIQPEIYTFRCGLPAIDNQNETSFYQFLSDGKIKLVKSFRRIIHEEKDQLSGEVKKEYRTYENYYLYNGTSSIQKLKKDKVFMLNIM